MCSHLGKSSFDRRPAGGGAPVAGQWRRVRSPGPGVLYNIGNVLALCAGVIMQWVQMRGEAGVGAAVVAYFAGSPGALWLTGSMVLFILAGGLYHRGWSEPSGTQPRLVQLGDLISGLAAILLTVALVWMGDTALALLAGVLLAGGKLGTAVLPTMPVPGRGLLDGACRMAVIVSRGPSIAALAVALLDTSGSLADVALPATMIVCFLLWFWADLLLLRAGPVQLIEGNR
ncbi:hypothetical protein [uncultured Roseobacter sp.]|uniref:hypothetical protein n=1 Tax=uncultured Roseobacter sp. TaxID=114847 RepID=UPI002628FE7B|nr:hypothetical protein [uncultured Roseobacter sp.]